MFTASAMESVSFKQEVLSLDLAKDLDKATIDDIRHNRLKFTMRIKVKKFFNEVVGILYKDSLHKTAKVYEERAQLVAALSKHYHSYLCNPKDETPSEGFSKLVVIDLPTGQASWHLSDKDLKFFEHLAEQENNWDGHTKKIKYERVNSLPTRPNFEDLPLV